MTPAAQYAALRQPDRMREQRLLDSPRKLPELEIQARWFAGEFGRDFKTVAGSDAHIVQFGVWNREAGPDFAEAAVSFDGAAPKRGCIELDTDVRDWERHGHATNPGYENVVLHLFLHRGEADGFTRTHANREVPQVQINLAQLKSDPPNPVPVAKPGRCVAPLRELAEEQVRAVLEGAAQFRLQKKSARLARLIEVHGGEEALYQSLAAALGYKSNQLAFTVLAQRLPLKLLLASKTVQEALLFGVSGFLNAADFTDLQRDTRDYLREVWRTWWKRRPEFERLALPLNSWNLSGQRPANHPQRRIAALAQIVKHWSKLRALSKACDVGAIRTFFGELSHEYWDHHFTLTSERSVRPLALVGASRITEMLANVFFPLAMLNQPDCWESYRKLPATLSNRRVEVAAVRLFGGSTRKRELTRTVAHQQGLLQIYEDFCMQDDSDCDRCLFPKQLGRWCGAAEG